jgi:ubiquinone/menaquinone biosynthesis C-methylase UbiE
MSYEQEIERVKKYYSKRIENHKEAPSHWLTPAPLYMLQRREEETMKLIKRLGKQEFSKKSLLEVGCGNGSWISRWSNLGIPLSSLYGVDIMEEYVENSKKLTPFPSQIQMASVTEIPFEDNTFDIVSQSTVFTSILDPQARKEGAQEILRVLKKGGSVYWYDFRYPSPRNPNVRKVDKKELCRLFPNCDIKMTSVTLLPPLVRKLSPVSFTLCRLLENIPFLRSHYLAIIKKR